MSKGGNGSNVVFDCCGGSATSIIIQELQREKHAWTFCLKALGIIWLNVQVYRAEPIFASSYIATPVPPKLFSLAEKKTKLMNIRLHLIFFSFFCCL